MKSDWRVLSELHLFGRNYLYLEGKVDHNYERTKFVTPEEWEQMDEKHIDGILKSLGHDTNLI